MVLNRNTKERERRRAGAFRSLPARAFGIASYCGLSNFAFSFAIASRPAS